VQHTGVWWGNLAERGHSEDLSKDNIKLDIKEIECQDRMA
jgi:hypothetical protein